MKFHHIGICCKNILEEIKDIKQIHSIKTISDIVYDERQDAELCMIELKEGILIELISGKQVEKLIKKNISYYHLCYETENITFEKQKLINNGALLLSDEKDAVLFFDKKVCFLMVSYGIIELIETI
ncbi:MAG: VOC family protein [Fusobacteriaceae bacterium]|jgi:methylmalonyl-CoA/ethylmalonyl-CoA epimerase|nr:VOC family protein [Fusobacteriaceae bacterium]